MSGSGEPTPWSGHRAARLLFAAALVMLAVKPLADIPGEKVSGDMIDLGTIVSTAGALLMVAAFAAGRLLARTPMPLVLAFGALVALALISAVDYLLLRARAEYLALFDVPRDTRRTVVFGPIVAPEPSLVEELARLAVEFAPLALLVAVIARPGWLPRRWLVLVARTVLAGTVVHCVLAWLQVAGVVPYSFVFQVAAGEFGRASGGYFHPLSLGFLLTFGVILLGLLRDHLGWPAWLRLGLIALFLGTGLVTLHRMTIVCLVLVITIQEFPHVRRALARPRQRVYAWAAAAVVVAAGVGAAVRWGEAIWTRAVIVVSTIGPLDVTSDRFMFGRGAVWSDTITALRQASAQIWLFGIGYEPWDTHNDLLRLVMIWGAVGVGLIGVVLVGLFRLTRRLVDDAGRRALLLLYLFTVVFGLLQKPLAYPYFVWLLLFGHAVLVAFYRRAPVPAPVGGDLGPGPASLAVPRQRVTGTPVADPPVPAAPIAEAATDGSITAAELSAPEPGSAEAYAETNPPLPPPMFSICTVVRDRPTLLIRAVRSVLASTVTDFELIVVDDGSAIPVTRVLAEAGLDDDRVRVVALPPSGIGPARNTGLRLARGAFVTVLDSDDELAPDGLERLRALLSETGAEWVYADFEEVTGQSRRIVRVPAFDHPAQMMIGVLMRPRVPFKHSGMTIKRELLLRLGGYDESLVLFEDIDLVLRGLNAGLHPRRLGHPIVRFYRHAQNASRRRLTGIRVWLTLINRYGPTRRPAQVAAIKTVRTLSELGKWLVSAGR
jgi:GT2 family glycosyltransferase